MTGKGQKGGEKGKRSGEWEEKKQLRTTRDGKEREM